MDAIKSTQFARALLSSHGDKAEAEVARKMRRCEETGKHREAADWRKVRMAISEMRGPRQA